MKLSLRKRSVVIAADGLLLLMGLFGTVFSFLSAFKLAVNFFSLLGACVLAALCSLAIFSLPKAKYRLPLVGARLLWLGWMVWRYWSDLVYSALLWTQAVGTVFAQKMGMGLVPPDLSPWLAPLWTDDRAEMLARVTLFCVLITALLALGLGWAVVRRRSFWLSFLLTFPILLAPLTITITPSWLPLTALLLFWCILLLRRLPGRQDPYGGAKMTFLLLPLCALLLSGLRFALPQEKYSQNRWAETARLELVEKFGQLGSGIVSGGFGTGFVGGSVEVDLSQAGPLRYTGKTVLRVESEVSGHIYLRGFSAAAYGEHGWEQLSDEDYEEMREGWEYEVYQQSGEFPMYSSVYHPPERNGDTLQSTVVVYGTERTPGIGDTFQPINFPALADPGGESHRFTIENVGAATPYVYTPYHLSTTPERMTGAEFVGDSYLARATGIWRYVLYANDKANPEHGARLSGGAAEAEEAYRSFVTEHYMDTPEELQSALSEAVSAIWNEEEYYYGGGLPGASLYNLDAAEAVADYLSKLAVYDPETPRTPEGRDFVEYFLTESHTGYCMHFASAATLILRSMGVPARYVAGYTADVKAGQTVPVADNKAHAWVEVYCDGYGWQPVEVTPGFSESFPWSGAQTEPTPSHTPPPSESRDPRPTPAPSKAPTPGAAGGEARGPIFDLRPLLPVAAVLLVGWLLVKRRQWMAKRRRARFEQADANRAVVAMYLYDQRLLRYHPREELDTAVHVLGEKAVFSTHTLTEDERQRVRSYSDGLAVRTDALLGFWRRLMFRYILCLY